MKPNTVARPTEVNPTICVNVSSQAKCSVQICVRGLNSGANSPLEGSLAWMKLYLEPLHPRHENARFSRRWLPRRDCGLICSIENGSGEKAACVMQYSQHPFAC